MRSTTMAGLAACLLISLAAWEVAAESSPVEISESTFNSGGNPEAGVVPASAGFRITLDALGNAVAGTAMSSASYRIAGGLVSAFPPPGAVKNLRFASVPADTLSWDAEPSAGRYAVYRGNLGDLASPGGPSPYGDCLTAPVNGTSTIDGTDPPDGQGFFYLVTVANRLDEEGTKSVDGAAGPVGRPFTCNDSCFCDPDTCAGGCNN